MIVAQIIETPLFKLDSIFIFMIFFFVRTLHTFRSDGCVLKSWKLSHKHFTVYVQRAQQNYSIIPLYSELFIHNRVLIHKHEKNKTIYHKPAHSPLRIAPLNSCYTVQHPTTIQTIGSSNDDDWYRPALGLKLMYNAGAKPYASCRTDWKFCSCGCARSVGMARNLWCHGKFSANLAVGNVAHAWR